MAATKRKKPAAKTATTKPCTPHANGRPRVRDPVSKRCRLAASNRPKRPKRPTRASPSPKRPKRPKRPAVAAVNNTNKACVSPKAKVPGTSYTWLKMVRDLAKTLTKTSLYWGPVIVMIAIAFFYRNMLLAGTGALVTSLETQAEKMLSPFDEVSKTLRTYLGKIAFHRTQKMSEGVVAASKLCSYYGNEVIKSIVARAEELGHLFTGMCSARFGDSASIDQVYLQAASTIVNAKEDPIVRLGVQKVLAYQVGLGPGNGTNFAEFSMLQQISKANLTAGWA